MNSLRSRVPAAAALVLVLGLSIPATAQQREPGLLDQLFGGSDRFRGGERSAPPEESGPGVPQTDLVVRVERLEAQIRQLTGENERLQFRNRQLETQVQQLGGVPVGAGPAPVAAPPARPMTQGALPAPAAAAAPPAVVQTMPAPAPAGASGRRSDAFDPALHPNAPGAPRALGALPTGSTPAYPNAAPASPYPSVAAEPPVGRAPGSPLDLSSLSGVPSAVPPETTVASASVPPASGPLPPPPSRNPSGTGAVASIAPPSDSPRDHYDLGYGYILRKDYALAEQSLQEFLKKYPKDRLAPDAQYWLGESLYQRQRYDEAAASFLDLSTKHASHPKAPEALLRLGQSLAQLGQKDMSCATLNEAKRKYPRMAVNVKQGVDREQKRVGC